MKENKMGPLRFELRSEDPQSPRMARLPYGPALLLLDDIVYVCCYFPSLTAGEMREEKSRRLFDIGNPAKGKVREEKSRRLFDPGDPFAGEK